MADVHGAARLGAGSSTSARATLASGCARHSICSWQPPAPATAARWQGGDGSVSRLLEGPCAVLAPGPMAHGAGQVKDRHDARVEPRQVSQP
jgi:hypothetical protein